MSNEEREYQAGNLPLPTDEEYEEDAKQDEEDEKVGGRADRRERTMEELKELV